MNVDGEVREDVQVPDSELGQEISSRFDEGEELNVLVVSVKVDDNTMIKIDNVTNNKN